MKTAERRQDLGEIDWNDCPGIDRSPKKLSGAWCFQGTRLPVHALFMNLSSGMTIPEFLKMFPTANEEQIRGVCSTSWPSGSKRRARTERGLRQRKSH